MIIRDTFDGSQFHMRMRGEEPKRTNAIMRRLIGTCKCGHIHDKEDECDVLGCPCTPERVGPGNMPMWAIALSIVVMLFAVGVLILRLPITAK